MSKQHPLAKTAKFNHWKYIQSVESFAGQVLTFDECTSHNILLQQAIAAQNKDSFPKFVEAVRVHKRMVEDALYLHYEIVALDNLKYLFKSRLFGKYEAFQAHFQKISHVRYYEFDETETIVGATRVVLDVPFRKVGVTHNLSIDNSNWLLANSADHFLYCAKHIQGRYQTAIGEDYRNRRRARGRMFRLLRPDIPRHEFDYVYSLKMKIDEGAIDDGIARLKSIPDEFTNNVSYRTDGAFVARYFRQVQNMINHLLDFHPYQNIIGYQDMIVLQQSNLVGPALPYLDEVASAAYGDLIVFKKPAMHLYRILHPRVYPPISYIQSAVNYHVKHNSIRSFRPQSDVSSDFEKSLSGAKKLRGTPYASMIAALRSDLVRLWPDLWISHNPFLMFNGIPPTPEARVARWVGIPRISKKEQLNYLTFMKDKPAMADRDVNDLLSFVHASELGKMLKSHTSRLARAYLGLRKKHGDIKWCVNTIVDAWSVNQDAEGSLMETSKNIRATSILSKHKKKHLKMSLMKDDFAISSMSMKEAVDAVPDNPDSDDDTLAEELRAFREYADDLLEKSRAKRKDRVLVEPFDERRQSRKDSKRALGKRERLKRRLRDEVVTGEDSMVAQGAIELFAPIAKFTQRMFESGMLPILGCIASICVYFLVDNAIVKGLAIAAIGGCSLMMMSGTSFFDLAVGVKVALAEMAPMFSACTSYRKAIVEWFSSWLKLFSDLEPSGVVAPLVQELDKLPDTDWYATNQAAEQVADDQWEESASSSNMKAQGALETLWETVSGVFCRLIGFVDSKELSNRMRLLTMGISIVKSTKDIFRNFVHVFVNAVNWVSIRTLGVQILDDSDYVFADQVGDVVSRWPGIYAMIREPETTRENMLVVSEYIEKMRKLYFENSWRDAKEESFAPLIRVYKSFAECQQLYLAKLPISLMRVEPVGVLFQGDAGTGKSSLAQYLIRVLSDLGACTNANFYQKPVDVAYEEGLRDQSHILFEEWCTMNDPDKQLRDVGSLLSMVNVAPRPINYASVENKGVHYDKSEFCWFTTNQKFHCISELVPDFKAVLRRFELIIEPKLPEDGKIPVTDDGNIDWSKFTFLVSKAKHSFENEMHLSSMKQEKMSIRDIVRALALAREKRIKQYKAALSNVASSRARFVEGYEDLKSEFSKMELRLEPQGFATDTMLTRCLAAMQTVKKPFLPLQVEDDLQVIQKHVLENCLKLTYVPIYSLGSVLPVDGRDFAFCAGYARMLGDESLARVYEYAARKTEPTLLERLAERFDPNRPQPKKTYVQLLGEWATSLRLRTTSWWEYLKNKASRAWSLSNMVWLAVNHPMYTLLRFVVQVAGFVVMGMYGWKMIKNYSTKSNIKAQSIIRYTGAGDRETDDIADSRRKLLKHHRWDNAQPENEDAKPSSIQSGLVPQAHQPDFSRLPAKAYVYIIWSKYNSPSRCVAIEGRTILTNHHTARLFDEYDEFVIKTHIGEYPMKRSEIVIRNYAQEDLALIQLPIRVPQFPDIVDRFVTNADALNLGYSYTRYDHRNGELTAEIISEYTPITLGYYTDDSGLTFYTPVGLTLNIPGIAGDCGSIVACFDSNLGARNIVGIHSAGSATASQIILVTQELLKRLAFPKMIAQSGHVKISPPSASLLSLQKAAVATGNAQLLEAPIASTIIGTVDPPSHLPRKSRLVESKLFDKISPHEKEPGILSKYDPRAAEPLDPLRINYAKMVKSTVSHDLPDHVCQDIADQIIKHVPTGPCGRRRLTLSEAVKGRVGLNPCNFKGSAGFYWTTHPQTRKHGDTSKGAWMKILNDGSVWVHPELQSKIEADIAMLEKGEVPLWLIADNLKDETRPLEKVKSCSTRLYNCSPVDDYMVGRILLGSFIAAVEHGRFKTPLKVSCAVGLDPNDLGIPTILASHATHRAIALDQKAFDQHQLWEIAKFIATSACKWYKYAYDSKEWTAVFTYCRATYMSHHVVGNIVYEVLQGMISGKYLTSHFNSFYVEFAHIGAIFLWSVEEKAAGRRKTVLSPKQIKDMLLAFYYGDDSLVLVPDLPDLQIRSADFIRLFPKFGLEATHCVKTLALDAEPTPEQITFLKRRIYVNPEGHRVFALDKATIYDMPNYIKKKYLHDVSIYNAIVTSMLTEISLHGKKEFSILLNKIVDAFKSIDMLLYVQTDYAVYFAKSQTNESEA